MHHPFVAVQAALFKMTFFKSQDILHLIGSSLHHWGRASGFVSVFRAFTLITPSNLTFVSSFGPLRPIFGP